MPIPKKLLIHSAELITKFDPDRWGKPQSEEKISLEHVRVEPSAGFVTDSQGVNIRLSATLFFDCKNSAPEDAKFALVGDKVGEKIVAGQQINFGGRIFTVRTVDILYGDNAEPHHLEVGLE